MRATLGGRILTGVSIVVGLWALAGGVAVTSGFLLLDLGHIGTGWIGLPYWAPLGAGALGLLLLSVATRRKAQTPAPDGLGANALCWAVLASSAGLVAWTATEIVLDDVGRTGVGIAVGWALVGGLGLVAARQTARLVGRYAGRAAHVPG